ncbi:hypothetical protein Tco_0326493, partial [Tanacetum coccineum]|jgi:ankyrin repeat protein
MLAM